MIISKFANHIAGLEIELYTDGEQLFFRGPREALTPPLVEQFKQNKSGLVQLLKTGDFVSKTYPLSHSQRSLWFINQSAPESSAYNTALAMRLFFNVDRQALESAIGTLLARHSCLRTTFSLEPDGENESIQKVHSYREAFLERFDASGWTSEELEENVKKAHQRPFNLETGPVLRAGLFTKSEKDHVLLLSIHHIVCDGWSMWILMEELWKIYFEKIRFTDLPAASRTRLARLSHSYEDYVRWQSEMLDSEGERQWRYWQKRLAGELPSLNLPLDRPRPAVQTYLGHWIPFELDTEMSDRLKALARERSVTLYTLLLSAYQLLLHKYTGQDDILIGTPTTGRSQDSFDGIVGHFVNTVVMRARFSGDPSFTEYLETSRKEVLDAFENQDYPFSLLVERINPKRDPSRTPVFQTLFVFQKQHTAAGLLGSVVDFYIGEGRIKVGDMEFASFPISQQEGQFDMSIEVVDAGPALRGVLKYNRDLFREDSMAGMAGHYVNLLQDIARNPSLRLSELQLMREEEKKRVLTTWNDTGEEWDLTCVHELFEEQAAALPDATALAFGNKTLSYGELNNRANRIAAFLAGQGIKPDDSVGICVERSFDMVAGVIGILKAGGAYVPLDPHYPRERLSYMLENSRISVLLVNDHLADLFEGSKAKAVRLEQDRQAIEQGNGLNVKRNTSPENLAYILYTSGSTGEPKGVAMPHRALCNLLRWQKREFVASAAARTLQFTTLNFDVSFQEIFSTLCSGGTLVLINEELRQDPVALLLLMNTQAVQRIFTPFVFLQILADTVDKGEALLPSMLQEIVTAGEQLRITRPIIGLLTKLKECALVNQYGPTEAHVVTSLKLEGEPETWPLLPFIGKPIANSRIYIMDRHGKPVPPGVIGEIHIGGMCLARGYYEQPEMTEKKFTMIELPTGRERVYRTGDLGRFLPDGNIEFFGRSDHQVKIRGFRVELAEIENHLMTHGDVSDAVVIGRENEIGIKSLCAYFVSVRDIPAGELKAFLLEKIPNYMIPSYFVGMKKIPLLPNNKVDRLSLPKPEQSIVAGVDYVAPRDELEKRLVGIWKQILNLEKIGVSDNLFDIGGNSLTTLTIQRKINELYPGKVRIPDLIQYPTIAGLAAAMKQRSETDCAQSERDEQFNILLDAITQDH